MKELVLGCSTQRKKLVGLAGTLDSFEDPLWLDMDPTVGADVLHDLDVLPYPFADAVFDEVHAYNVLEHTGSLGDWKFFFAQWNELARLTKVGGHFMGVVPALASAWLWGDPGHKRPITPEQLSLLDRRIYGTGQLQSEGYLPYLKHSWELVFSQTDADHFIFILRRAD
jgi:hypothetical protein